MNQETKDIIRPLIESVAAISAKQSIIMELLTLKLDLTEIEKSKILSHAKESERRSLELYQSAKVLK